MVEAILHQGQPIYQIGKPLSEAKAAMIMIHGRFAGPNGILPHINDFEGDDFAYLAPAAAEYTWYPDRFLVSTAKNEPYLSSGLKVIDELLKHIEEAGIPAEKTILLGFSQGGCLALEYAARNPQKFGGVVGWSSGLIGADDELTGYEGSLDGTPVFMGCSDVDFHIPLERVHQSSEIMKNLGAEVDSRIYPNMGHTVNLDEIKAVNAMIKSLVS